MRLKDTDTEKLWGLSAGRCNYPVCNAECIKFLGDKATILGEMAHIIAQSERGPRGIRGGGKDCYDNLILLCPSHHTEIDKAPPGTFTIEKLRLWKINHEASVARALESPCFETSAELRGFVQRLLTENRVAWQTYGPESETAQCKPESNAVTIWILRKLSLIVPNNKEIIAAVTRNASLLASEEYEAFSKFVEHAEGLERNCYEPTEGVPIFPKNSAKW